MLPCRGTYMWYLRPNFTLHLKAAFGSVFVDGDTHYAIVRRQVQLKLGTVRLVSDGGCQLAALNRQRVRLHCVHVALLAPQPLAERRIVTFLRRHEHKLRLFQRCTIRMPPCACVAAGVQVCWSHQQVDRAVLCM